ncbi:hypothetical protein ATPR_0386 [Acetobacter tropicalis NBRC 101654]|uniref:Uncharacterized protein n=1 Tax=Acetobacter tropicalis NBRC 101654 TaxID=749388 RepID=F7VAI7_9PROT|nr:hypothetical protein ATPR_0386 [Acetobacter tropicalis NBRC 101654]
MVNSFIIRRLFQSSDNNCITLAGTSAFSPRPEPHDGGARTVL